ncbi:MAG: GspH/FimT family pseudopilin [Gammaproteobacteria bacterium]
MSKLRIQRRPLGPSENRSSGFTLVELMITLALAAIILSAAVPSFRDLVQNNRITAQVNEFITALSLARSEAIKRGATLRVTALAGGGASNEFGMGWRVWADADGDGSYDAGEELRETAALSGGATLDSVSVPAVTEVQYLPSGLLNIAAGTTQSFQLRIPQCRGNQARNVTILPTGRATIATVACA